MSTKSSDSYVDIMEAGKSTLVHMPAPKKKKLLWSAGPPDHVGEKLALIECASILLIGISSCTIAEAAAAGYYGGRTDDILMRITEVFQTIPSFVFAILLVAIMKPSIDSIVVAITVVSWPGVARLVRGEFLALKNREFVQACHTLGMSDRRIMLAEILPNCLSPIIVIGSLMVATAILIESGLAFLGLGDPNIMSWGFQIGAGRTMLRSAWWICTFPGIAILITVLAINLVGEGLNDALNPRLRERN